MASFADYYRTPAERGYLAESFPGSLVDNSLVPSVAGRHEMIRLKVPQAGWCTNIVLGLQTAGSSLTAGQNFAALYTAAGVLIAQSVDQTTNWGGTGNKNAQLNGGPYFLSSGEYYATFWYNGTTAPALIRQGGLVAAGPANGTTTAPNLLYANNAASLTTAAPGTLGTQTAGGTVWWVALS